MAAAQSESQSIAQPGGEISVSSLGATNEVPGSVAGSLSGSLAALGSLDPTPSAPYVALGDSYAAFGDQTGLDPEVDPCLRSETNYPSALVETAGIEEYADVTCGGAVISDLVEGQHEGVAPQLDALGAETDLVTLSIGGNDAGFSRIVGCITQHLPSQTMPQDCRAALDTTVREAIEAVYGERGTIDQVYEQIADAAPEARVVATQYMPLMPDTDGCAFTAAIGQDNLDWSREITRAINTAVDEAAERHGHDSVLPTSDIDRSACADPDVRWTQFLADDPADEDGTGAAAFHPTTLGQAAMAEAISATIAAEL